MLDLETAISPHAWRVEFAEGSKAPPDGVEAIEIVEPRIMTALLAPIAPSEALAQAGPQAGELAVVWMPPGANTPATIERDVNEWMRSASTERKEASARADVRTIRVLWGKSRAVIYANQGDLRVALDAVLRFCVAQRETLALETTMRSTWASIEADAALTHALTPRDRRRQPHVNEMTQLVTRMKMTWLRVNRSLEQLDPALAEPSKRLFAELVAAVSLFDQVETMEAQVQFALDHYEIINTRLIDMTLVRQERIESIVGYGLVIMLLLVQIWMMSRGM
jgi:hypothetical protein